MAEANACCGRLANTEKTLTFGAAGNNTVVNADGTVTTYAWDLANRMGVAALPSSEVVTLLYDPTGLRRSRQDASAPTAFVWDGQSLLEEHMSGRNVGAGDVSEPKEASPPVWRR